MKAQLYRVAYDVCVALAAFLIAIAFVIAVRYGVNTDARDATLAADIGRIVVAAAGVFAICVALRVRLLDQA